MAEVEFYVVLIKA